MKTFTTIIIQFSLFIVFTQVHSQITVELQPNSFEGKDAKINSLNLYDPGTSKEFIASSWTFQGIPGDVRSFIQFDLSFIPKSAVVTNAILNLYTPDTLPSGPHSQLSGSNEAWIEKVIEPWEEGTINWNNQPISTQENRVYISASDSAYQNYSIELSQMVQEMINNPEANFGFKFVMQTEEYYRRLNFASSDYPDSSLHPKLIITYYLPPSDLLLHYPVVGNANDISGNDFHGLPQGCTLTTDKCGNPDNAYNLDGVDDYIEIPGDPLLKQQFPLSITTWINIDEFPEVYNSGIFTNDFFEDYYTGLWIGCLKTQRIGIGFGNGGTVSPYNRRSKLSTFEINTNEWFHLTAVFESAEEMRLYINGMEDPGTYEGYNTGTIIDYSNEPGRIGSKDFHDVTGYFDGQVDEITFWSKALTQFEIDSIYESTANSPTANYSYLPNELTVEFRNMSINADDFYWNFGDESTSTETNPTHIYSSTGAYTVTLIASNGCSADSITKIIKVCAYPQPSFSAYINYYDVYFENHTDTTCFFQWNFGDGKTSTELNPKHTYDSEGYYQVCLQATNECGTEIFCDSIYIAPLPLSNFSFELTNGQVQFNNLGEDYLSCFWDFGDGNTSTEINPVHQYESAGTYTTCLIVEKEFGLYSHCENVVVESGMGLEEYYITINYPNDILSVNLGDVIKSEIRLFDLNGKLLIKNVYNSSKPALDISSLRNGIYIVQIMTKNKIFRAKFYKN